MYGARMDVEAKAGITVLMGDPIGAIGDKLPVIGAARRQSEHVKQVKQLLIL